MARTEGSPIVFKDTVIVAVGGRVYAVDRITGNQQWRFPKTEAIRGSYRYPTLVGNVVCVPASNNVLYGIDATSGRQLWQYELRENNFLGKPVATGNSVTLSVGTGGLISVNAADGKPLWEQPYAIPGGVKGSIGSYRSNALFFNQQNELTSFNVNSGRPDWKIRFENISNTARPYSLGDSVYVYTGQYVAALQASNGRPRWQRSLPGDLVYGPAVGTGGTLVVTRDGQCYVLDASGRPKFAEAIELGSQPVTSPSAIGDYFLVPTSNGVLNMINPKDGSVMWSYVVTPITAGLRDQRNKGQEDYIGIAAAGDPAVVGKTLLVLAQDGSLLAFDSELGLDMTGPEVVMGWPTPGAQVNARPPFYFAFRVTDATSGVDSENVKILVNGKEAEYEFGRDGIAVVRLTQEGPNLPLKDGRAIIEVVAEDWLGNKSTQTYSIMVDSTLPPLAAPGQKPNAAAGKGGAGRGRGGKGAGGRAGG